jgi:ankyrin repeat protein
MSVLRCHGAEVDIVGGSGETPLHVAVVSGNYHAVAFLLGEGADGRRKVAVGTPLQMAVLAGSMKIVALLLRSGMESEGLEFSEGEKGREVEQFVREERWKEDEWDPEKMADEESEARVEDVMSFVYPKCPEIDISQRYTNTEYARGIVERNKHLTAF